MPRSSAEDYRWPSLSHASLRCNGTRLSLQIFWCPADELPRISSRRLEDCNLKGFQPSTETDIQTIRTADGGICVSIGLPDIFTVELKKTRILKLSKLRSLFMTMRRQQTSIIWTESVYTSADRHFRVGRDYGIFTKDEVVDIYEFHDDHSLLQ
jgi:hypothetical protein